MKRSIAVAAVVGLIATSASAADNDTGLYLGAGAGQFNVEIDSLADVPETAENFDDDDTCWKIFAGWRFAKFFAVELNYMDLGKAEDSLGPIPVKTEINGFAPYLVGTVPLGPVELFARAGYYFYDIKINQESIETLDDSADDFVYGAGIGLTLFDHLHARLEYEVIEISEVDDSNAFWISGAWRF